MRALAAETPSHGGGSEWKTNYCIMCHTGVEKLEFSLRACKNLPWGLHFNWFGLKSKDLDIFGEIKAVYIWLKQYNRKCW